MSVQTAVQFRRSPFFYVGDKYKLLAQLEDNFPKDIDRFIEPFCGGGSVFLNTEANQYLLNDIDTHMILLHRFLVSYSDKQDEFWEELKEYILAYNLSATFLNRNVPDDLRNLKKSIANYYELTGDISSCAHVEVSPIDYLVSLKR